MLQMYGKSKTVRLRTMVQHDGVQPGVQQTVHPGIPIYQLDSLLATEL